MVRQNRETPRGSASPNAIDKVDSRGVPYRARQDMYHALLLASWPKVILLFAFTFLISNVGFALLFMAAPGGIHGVNPSLFRDHFFFSVQTMTTIGYGAMSPVSSYAHTLVVIEAFYGILSFALTTGLIFSKFARPTAQVLFSDKVVITTLDGKPTLMIRIANKRRNRIVQAKANVTLLTRDVSTEGHRMIRFHDLPLVRPASPVFYLTWTLMHVIDEHSPLYDALEKGAKETYLITTLSGIDDTFSQMIQARKNYRPADIVQGARYADMVEYDEDTDTAMIDYDRMHEVIQDS